VFDTHSHLDVDLFDRDRDEVVARARAAGVEAILVPAIRPATWPGLRVLAETYDLVRLAFGVHPQVVPELHPGEVDDLVEKLIASDGIAIGETGLDGATGDQDRQEALFRAHIRAARERKLPLIIHVLRAHDVAPRILREEKAHEVGGVMHSYSGGAALVGVYRDLGMAFSFAGPVTYPNARKPVEAARLIPDDLLLAETDSPDQAPEPHRGGRSEPAFVADVIAGLAAIRGKSPEEMARLTTENARRIFGRTP
jgi:TatD DNase family protein